MTEASDVIDLLAGLPPASALRAARPTARDYAQKSHDALFVAPAPGSMPLVERLAVAVFVALLHGDAPAIARYEAPLGQCGDRGPVPDLLPALRRVARAAATTGPYGNGDRSGPTLRVETAAFGARLAAALDYAHLLVFHPRDAGRAALEPLVAAGWGATEIVTLAQVVSFLCFQIRAGAGLRVLASMPAEG
ncbi:CMD domain protein [Frigidibacter sp. MR17.24]|uniref:CMD domain protein n=1 Tax=Frigidibacter sp. MR17.24 TaxID=3127345 RepID=UPI003012E9C6